MNNRIEAIARVFLKRELRRLGEDSDKLRDMHDTEELIRLWDKKRGDCKGFNDVLLEIAGGN